GIFYEVSPILIDEGSESEIKSALNSYIEDGEIKRLKEEAQNQHGTECKIALIEVTDHDFHTIIVQLRALGLITQSTKNRSVKDTKTYWTLTPYGNEIMTRIRAIKKDDYDAAWRKNPFRRYSTLEEAS
ncbi:MAG: hypothetical protein AAGC77_11735, partial [Pseudomonadota bacterium]